MLDNIYRVITNVLSLVPIQVRSFQAHNPEAHILVAGASKARKMPRQDSEVRFEAGWITARRAALILTEDRLVCGTWEIPIASIMTAKLLRVKSLFAKALILKISTDSENYQFGLQYDPGWEKQTALPLTIEDGKIEYSLFSIAIRVLIFILAIWYLLNRIL